LRFEIKTALGQSFRDNSGPTLMGVLKHLDITKDRWYPRPSKASDGPSIKGRKPTELSQDTIDVISGMCRTNPWYGYKRIAVMVRRCGYQLSNRAVFRVMKDLGLLKKKVIREAEKQQTMRLLELLPTGPNQLWQMDVTYLHIPGHGWWYAVTVIDYYSRYLLAIHFTANFTARECLVALEKAREEAKQAYGGIIENIRLLTDNGSSFLAKRFQQMLTAYGFEHFRIQYRTPQQLGLLERFHQTLKAEEVHWKLYESPSEARVSLEVFRERYNWDRPHWALRESAKADPRVPAEVYCLGKQVEIPSWQEWALAAKDKLKSWSKEEKALKQRA
jgi:transposase InsO family protein